MMFVLVEVLELAVLAGLGMMFGAMIYSTYVEIPVRQKLDAQGQVQNWQLVFPVASGFLKPFGIGIFSLFVVVGFVTANWIWGLSALLLIAVQPFTAMFIAKTNANIAAIEPTVANDTTITLIRKWDRLHNIRTILIASSFACALIAHFQSL